MSADSVTIDGRNGFRGEVEIASSKSEAIRAFVVRSFLPTLAVRCRGDVPDDVYAAIDLADELPERGYFDARESGAVLRFGLARASRLGDAVVYASERAVERPSGALFEALSTLGVRISRTRTPRPGFEVLSSGGWEIPPEPLRIRTDEGSQALSAILLSAWNLPHDLEIEVDRLTPYALLTLRVLRNLGVVVRRENVLQVKASRVPIRLVVPARAKPRLPDAVDAYYPGADYSSAAYFAALGVGGSAKVYLGEFPSFSAPDADYGALLGRVGATTVLDGKSALLTTPGPTRRDASIDVSDNPDLAPLLAVLAAYVDGFTVLYGGRVLRGKESDRIATSIALVRALGREAVETSDGFLVRGRIAEDEPEFVADAAGDHRLAMAAAVGAVAGRRLGVVRGASSVSKSFPSFWRDVIPGLGA